MRNTKGFDFIKYETKETTKWLNRNPEVVRALGAFYFHLIVNGIYVLVQMARFGGSVLAMRTLRTYQTNDILVNKQL